MRISTSENYWHNWKNCPGELSDCARLYCHDHRLLYRMCESVKDRGDDGEWYTGDCHKCHKEWELKHYKECVEASRRG